MRRLELPCGRYYLNSISFPDSLTIVTRGRVALFVGGSATGHGRLTIAPEGDGELDLFVTGSLGITKLFTEGLDLVLGSVAHPARTRVYTASERGIQFTSRPGATTRATSVIAGNLYVPHGIVNWSGELAVFGGVLAEGVAGAGNIAVHYDTDVLRAGAPCGPPPAEQCTSCRNCRNQACIGGMCGACRTSADCCAPLECYRGECVVVPP